IQFLYVRNERLLEQRRGQVNPLLYGYSSAYGAALPLPTPAYGCGFGAYPIPVAGFGYPRAAVVNTLAFGIGNEGVVKNELVRGLGAAAAGGAVSVTTKDGKAIDGTLVREDTN